MFRHGSVTRFCHYFLHGFRAASLLAVATTILADTPPKAAPTGIIYLLKADRPDAPSRDLAGEACWANTHVDGTLLRTFWNKVQPQPGKIDWSFFDKGVTLAQQHRKKVGMLVTAGVTTPDWVYAAGATPLSVSGPRMKAEAMRQPLCWDATFKAKWGKVIEEFGARYDAVPEVAYVVIGGSGRRAESFVASTPPDIDAFDRAGGLSAWKSGVKWIIDKYASSFSRTPFLLDLGAPVPSAEGRAALASICDYGVAKYPGRFGVKSDGLSATYDFNSFGAREVKALSGKATVGFQMSLPWKGRKKPGGELLLADALRRGVELGAHFIEVYAADCKLPESAHLLDDASAALKKVHGR